MQFKATGLVGAIGSWGPFRDDPQGRTYPYVELVASDGSGIFRPTVAEGVEPPAIFATIEAELELTRSDTGKMKLRLVGHKPSTSHRADASLPKAA